MACIENIPPAHADSEREEGEIVDELDDLSDISSEEEYLLLQRLQVLENYNHVLERKEAKRCSIEPGNLNIREAHPHNNKLTEIPSIIHFDDSIASKDDSKIKYGKTVHHKSKNKEILSHDPSLAKYKDKRKKPYKQKRKVEPKFISESSDESDYEYRNKRRKLANAVLVTKTKTDTSLKARLMQMLCTSQKHMEPVQEKSFENVNAQVNLVFPKHSKETADLSEQSKYNLDNAKIEHEKSEVKNNKYTVEDSELINLSSDDGSIQIVPYHEETENTQKSVNDNVECNITTDSNKQCKTDEASDEDLELLRQFALKSKASKNQELNQEHEPAILVSEDEDSDTAELRLICLRSALLKKAIEMKRKQKLRRKMSQSTLYDDVISNEPGLPENKTEDNNTDTESVDMDIGSDDPGHDEKNITVPDNNDNCIDKCGEIANINKTNVVKEDDIEDDEDLLRAKLLTSLSKNLPHLVDLNSLDKINKSNDIVSVKKNTDLALNKNNVDKIPVEKRFIIHTGGSDTDDEPEATKNLTKMHLKLSEQPDFQQKLDLFLKSARKEVEDTKLPDVVQQSPNVPLPKTQKFIPKPLNHLPKNEQIEYRNLVKRMTELEKLKKARLSMTFWENEFKSVPILQETLKPRNVTINNTPQNILDEEIALSRKKIAEESAKVLKLREEHSNLIQKYKIVETELRNLSTAISFNKRQQKSAQNQLSKTRMKHQILLKRSTTTAHYKSHSTPQINSLYRPHIKVNASSKVQKENEPLKIQYFSTSELKSVKVSVINDFKEPAIHRVSDERLSIQIDVANNKKTVKIPKEVTYPYKEKGDINLETVNNSGVHESKKYHQNDTNKSENIIANDYQSPLQALTSAGWTEDPNGVLCPFDVGGSCKDANCKYLHPKDPSH